MEIRARSTEWIYCPLCKKKLRQKIRADTETKYLPLYCHWCRNEHIVNIKKSEIELLKSQTY